MPELPEVETVVRGLAPELTGAVIRQVEVRYPGCLLPADGKSRLHRGDAQGFAKRVAGKTILGVRRRAKNIILDLEDGLHLLAHLKMSGSLWLPPAGQEADAHTHLIFTLAHPGKEERELHFRDPRKFGYVLALSTAELESFTAKLGPEPLEVSSSNFAARVGSRKRNIKSLLLDQSVVVGVGNIYADEALHRAGIQPQRKANTLSGAELARLHEKLGAVLRQAIAENGSTFRDYVNARGDAGAFQNLFLVYGRGGKECTGCGTALSSDTVAGRTTVFCPRCQK